MQNPISPSLDYILLVWLGYYYKQENIFVANYLAQQQIKLQIKTKKIKFTIFLYFDTGIEVVITFHELKWT